VRLDLMAQTFSLAESALVKGIARKLVGKSQPCKRLSTGWELKKLQEAASA